MTAQVPPPVGTTPEEIYAFHVWLRAVKRCSDCGLSKPVEAFGAYGVERCQACRDRELDDYWASLKQRVGVTAA